MKLTSKLKVALKSILSVSLAEIETDKAVLVYDGELAEGIEVFVRDETAEDGVKPAEDGTYETETQIIEVADGKVTKITEKETEEMPEEGAENLELSENRVRFNKAKVAFEATYSEKMRKIYEAVAAKGYDAYVVDAADDFAIVEIWNEDNASWTDYRFALSWDGEGNVELGDGVEVVAKYVTKEESQKIDDSREGKVELAEELPADEPGTGDTEEKSFEDRLAALETLEGEIKNALEQILNGVASLEGRVESLEEKVSKLDETPADEPADDNSAEEAEVVSKAYYLRKNK